MSSISELDSNLLYIAFNQDYTYVAFNKYAN